MRIKNIEHDLSGATRCLSSGSCSFDSHRSLYSRVAPPFFPETCIRIQVSFLFRFLTVYLTKGLFYLVRGTSWGTTEPERATEHPPMERSKESYPPMCVAVRG